MMAVSQSGTVKIEQIVIEAAMNGDIAPVLASAPSLTFAVSVANQVQVAIVNGGPIVQTMGWKWNRFFPATFLTNSWQQDYASNNLNIAWLENCQAIDVNNTTVPKPAIDVYAVKDLNVTNVVSWPRYICWLPNNQLMFGSWGSAALNNEFGLTNPGASVVYTNPFGANLTPSNPITQVQDANGNYWLLTTYGTCGSFNPFALNITETSMNGSNVLTVTCANAVQVGQQVVLAGTAESFLNGQTVTVASVIGTSPNQTGFTATGVTHGSYTNASDTGTASIVPSFPTLAAPSTVATTVIDGTVIWSAINPYGQGFRIGPIPSQTGRVWGMRPIAQAKPVQYTSLESYITPIPDELYTYFLTGFTTLMGMRSADQKVRAKYQADYPLWIQSLDNAVRSGNREPDNFMFVPTAPIQQPAWGYACPRPDYPFGPAWAY
jgi:hypothetical protein